MFLSQSRGGANLGHKNLGKAKNPKSKVHHKGRASTRLSLGAGDGRGCTHHTEGLTTSICTPGLHHGRHEMGLCQKQGKVVRSWQMSSNLALNRCTGKGLSAAHVSLVGRAGMSSALGDQPPKGSSPVPALWRVIPQKSPQIYRPRYEILVVCLGSRM